MLTTKPWHVAADADGTMITDDSGAQIAMWPPQGGTVEQCAAARLIASAPAMLAALQKLVRGIDRLPGNNSLDGIADDARAAIARATGEQQ